MHASIESSGGGGPSTIDIPRPFPNDKSLFKDWADFFRQAQAKSQPVVGPGVLHYPDWNTEAGVEAGNTLCSVCRQPGFAVKKAGVDHTSLPQTWAVSYPTWQGNPVNCTGKCLAVLVGCSSAFALLLMYVMGWSRMAAWGLAVTTVCQVNKVVVDERDKRAKAEEKALQRSERKETEGSTKKKH